LERRGKERSGMGGRSWKLLFKNLYAKRLVPVKERIRRKGRSKEAFRSIKKERNNNTVMRKNCMPVAHWGKRLLRPSEE